LWLHSLKVAQLLRSAACLHTNQSRSYLNHLVQQNFSKQGWPIAIVLNVKYKEIMDDNIHKYYILFSSTT